MSSGQGGAQPGFLPVPWWNGGCSLQYAINPEAAFPALEWIGCDGNEPGCERVKKNWRPQSVTAIAVPSVFREGPGAYRFAMQVLETETEIYRQRLDALGPGE